MSDLKGLEKAKKILLDSLKKDKKLFDFYVYTRGYMEVTEADVTCVENLNLHVNLKQRWPVRWFDSQKDFISIGFVHRLSVRNQTLIIDHAACSKEFTGTKIYRLFIAYFLNEFVQFYNQQTKVKIKEVFISKTFHSVDPNIERIQKSAIVNFISNHYSSVSTQRIDNKWYVKFNWSLVSGLQLTDLLDQFERSQFNIKYLADY